jgi:glycosyltransferase involved in cell wall biosynthesis
MTRRKRILIFADYYLPSVGAGGGVRILANIVERFSDRYEFFVVARDHDSKTHRAPFTDIPLNQWTMHAETQTYYFSRHQLTSDAVNEIVKFAQPDLIFLNSVFAIPSVRFLWERRKGKHNRIPVIVSPCGEVLKDSLRHKYLKKKTFLSLANAISLFRNIVWRATSEDEKEAIHHLFGDSMDIHVLPDLTPAIAPPNTTKPDKVSGTAKIAYVARMVPNKNLHFLLERLLEVKGQRVELDIIGPHEDARYWARCKRWIAEMPDNIAINVTGLLSHEEVLDRMRNSHFFILPSETENFGYVIIEALALGCPVIISDRTPWNELDASNFAWILPLEDHIRWTDVIWSCAAMSVTEYRERSRQARAFAENWLSSSESEAKMGEMFRTVLDGGGKTY